MVSILNLRFSFVRFLIYAPLCGNNWWILTNNSTLRKNQLNWKRHKRIYTRTNQSTNWRIATTTYCLVSDLIKSSSSETSSLRKRKIRESTRRKKERWVMNEMKVHTRRERSVLNGLFDLFSWSNSCEIESNRRCWGLRLHQCKFCEGFQHPYSLFLSLSLSPSFCIFFSSFCLFVLIECVFLTYSKRFVYEFTGWHLQQWIHLYSGTSPWNGWRLLENDLGMSILCDLDAHSRLKQFIFQSLWITY
jgi:hypothetical protein